jgi:hypothetical protein
MTRDRNQNQRRIKKQDRTNRRASKKKELDLKLVLIE